MRPACMVDYNNVCILLDHAVLAISLVSYDQLVIS